MEGEDSHEITKMAALAAQFVNSTARHVFLTGKAGTGKTTFLHQLAASTHKRFISLAPAGRSAINSKGVTIHSQFLMPFGSFIPERQLPAGIPEYGAFHDRDTLNRRHPLNGKRRDVLRNLELLIIDEVSMLRADLLDAIDHRLRSVRGVYDRSFGGVQLLLIGDLFQLPPVVKDDEVRVLSKWYASPHFFEARAIKEAGYAHIELDKIFRQQDGNFIAILNNLRNNTVTAEDVTELNKHFRAFIPPADKEGVITLTTHNRSADEINQQALGKLPGKAHRFDAKVTGDFPQSMFPVLQEIDLKVGAQVMFIRNDQEKAYFNGKLAKVIAIDKDGVTVEMADGGNAYKLKKEVWENKRYAVDGVTKQQKEEILGTFEQYPIKLAWAITVHKSQGLTFTKAIIDVGAAFAPGQVYVALSRLRSLDGLILRTKIDPSVVSTDKDVLAFSARQHTQQPLPIQLEEQQRRYLQDLLAATFDLGPLLRKLAHVLKDHTETGEFEDESMRSALSMLTEKLKKEEVNTQKFNNQLQRLLQENDRTTMLDRIEKGGAYYGGLVRDAMKDLLQHLAQVEHFSRTKEYAVELREVDALLVQKVTMIAKAGHLAQCILSGEEVKRMPELAKDLADKRTALVAEVAAWAMENKPAGSTKTGKKRTAKDEDGVFVKKPRKSRPEKAVKGATYEMSYALLKEGKSIAEAAAARELTVGTLEGHVAKGIGEGVLEITDYLEKPKVEAVSTWMKANPEADSKAAMEHFAQAYSYGQLRMVQAWLKQEG
ncbi:MAG: AAA family ATPase [Flavobacteriales bacterium]|nr:AAA family ATPase [Flavobacteriales bacterium]